MKRKIPGIIIMILLTVVVVILGKEYKENRTDEKNKQIQNSTDNSYRPNGVLNLWYSDKDVQAYVESVATEFSDEYDITINCIYQPDVEYINNISANKNAEEGRPDLYIMKSDRLEQAVLLGVTEENTDTDIYNEANYSKMAINMASFKDKLVSYPMFFTTSALVYNKKYVTTVPDNFDAIKTFADEFETGDSTVENILQWDVSSIFYNFGFMGKYIDLAGDKGEDISKVDTNNERVKAAANYFHDLYSYFSIDINTINYDTMINEFINGKTVFTILGVDGIKKVEASELDFGVTSIPNLTNELETKTLSVSQNIAVNPYSQNKEAAKMFAKALSYDHANEIYEMTDRIPSREYETDSVVLNTMWKIYENSKCFPKLRVTSNYWLLIENAYKNIWKGEDADTIMNKLEEDLIASNN